MSVLTGVITAERARSATGRWTPCAADLPLRRVAGGMPGARPVSPRERQPLRARARAVLPLRHPSLPPPAAAGGLGPGADSLRRAITICSSGASRRRSISSWRHRRRTGRARPSPARWPPGYRSLAFQTLADQVRRSVRSVRGNQWMFRVGHPADYPLRAPPRTAGRRAGLSHPARDHARAHGPDAQRLERHFLSRHGFPRRRARPEHLDRSRGARPRLAGCAAEAAGRSLLPRDRRAGAAADQRRPAGLGRHHFARRGLRFRARLPRPAQGGRDRHRHRAAGHGRLGAAPRRPAGAAHRAGRATGSKSSAT